jgi:hypothetical protein
MIAGVIALILTGMGALLIIGGVIVSLRDRKQRLAAAERPEARPTAGVDLEGLAKLAEALGNKPLGFQMMILGTVLMLAGGVTGGVSSVS